MIPKEYYDFNNQKKEERSSKSLIGGRLTREKKQELRPCPSNDGRMLQWNELDAVYECFLCGYRTAKERVDPATEKIGAVSIVTADGYGGNDGLGGTSMSKPRIKAKWGSRSGETIRRARAAGVIRGDAVIEKWLNEPAQANTYLKSYSDSTKT